MSKITKPLQYFTAYYGLLQSAHVVTLMRGGVVLLKTGEMPFPAPSPPGGWSPQAIPFLVGMGIVDFVAICLALIFVFQAIVRQRIDYLLGIISLTIALIELVFRGIS